MFTINLRMQCYQPHIYTVTNRQIIVKNIIQVRNSPPKNTIINTIARSDTRVLNEGFFTRVLFRNIPDPKQQGAVRLLFLLTSLL